ncbi:hypothetical protein CNR22_20480 [Sphingobacteriaceae bacterium]|nr:hypothetical protein CNR22_20480 [Sphingobacteriaceae bacterium]
MNAKEKWINETENSLERIRPAEASPYLYSKILNRLQSEEKESIPTRLAWLAGATLLLLLCINLLVISISGFGTTNSGLEPLSHDLQLMNTNSINYN